MESDKNQRVPLAGLAVHRNWGHLMPRAAALWGVLQTDLSGLEMKRYDLGPGDRCTVEYVWMGHFVGPLADLSVLMSTLLGTTV